MTRDDLILAIFATTPLALFVIGVTADLLIHDTTATATATCQGCTHEYAVHNGADTKCMAPDCGCRSYKEPPEDDPVPIGCGG